jgi:prefoldin subunit 2
MSLTQ